MSGYKDLIDEYNITGPCSVNVDKVCSEDWEPKKGKKSQKLCRDMFIVHNQRENKYTLGVVRGFALQIKAQILNKQAKEIIKKLSLEPRRQFFRGFHTYRINWDLIDGKSIPVKPYQPLD